MKGIQKLLILMVATLVLTYIIQYVGYMFDDRVKDNAILLTQAALIALIVGALSNLLFLNRGRPEGATRNNNAHLNLSNTNEVSSDQAITTHPETDHQLTVNADASINTSRPEAPASAHGLDLRGLTINLLEMMALAERYERKLTLAMLAVDDYEVLLEETGNNAAKRVFQEVSEILTETLRVPDRSGVYADNRLLVILPETDVDNGKRTAERIRRQVVNTDVRIDARRRINATVSIGVAGFHAGDDPQALITRVEQALKEAQELGKNRTVSWVSTG